MRNWRSNPKVQAAQAFAKQFGCKAVITLFFDEQNVAYVSYGVNGPLCRAAQGIGDEIMNRLVNGEIETMRITKAMEAR